MSPGVLINRTCAKASIAFARQSVLTILSRRHAMPLENDNSRQKALQTTRSFDAFTRNQSLHRLKSVNLIQHPRNGRLDFATARKIFDHVVSKRPRTADRAVRGLVHSIELK
jgi:hypothetical protein